MRQHCFTFDDDDGDCGGDHVEEGRDTAAEPAGIDDDGEEFTHKQQLMHRQYVALFERQIATGFLRPRSITLEALVAEAEASSSQQGLGGRGGGGRAAGAADDLAAGASSHASRKAAQVGSLLWSIFDFRCFCETVRSERRRAVAKAPGRKLPPLQQPLG